MAGVWCGTKPDKCDVCRADFKGVFYDAKTTRGAWAVLCHNCFHGESGLGRLGVGLGQEYTWVGGEWRCTGGSSHA